MAHNMSFSFLIDEFRNGAVDDASPAGVDTTLSFENPDNMMDLPIIKYDQKQVTQDKYMSRNTCYT